MRRSVISRQGRAPVALRAFLVLVGLLAGLVAPSRASAKAATLEPVQVVVPQTGDLQLLAFWVALGAGYFSEEGIDVRVVTPSPLASSAEALKNGIAPVAVLSGPEYLRLIAERVPFALAASLLENETHELVVRRDVVERLHINQEMPVAQRLSAMHGVKIGVAPSARARLYKLFFSQGLDANIAQILTVRGEQQVESFGSGQIDALYTPSPNLERVLVEKDGVVLVDPAKGELPELSKRLIEALAVTRQMAEKEPGVVSGLVRAIARAERLLHSDVAASIAAVLRVVPSDPARMARLVGIYAAAVPAQPAVDAARITRELKFYPAGGATPSLAGVDVGRFVLGGAGGSGASGGGSPSRWLIALACALAFGAAALAVLSETRASGGETG